MSDDYCEGCSGDCDECGLNHPHEGPIVKGGGISKPEWWDEDAYEEYKRSAEGVVELCRVDPGDYDDPYDSPYR